MQPLADLLERIGHAVEAGARQAQQPVTQIVRIKQHEHQQHQHNACCEQGVEQIADFAWQVTADRRVLNHGHGAGLLPGRNWSTRWCDRAGQSRNLCFDGRDHATHRTEAAVGADVLANVLELDFNIALVLRHVVPHVDQVARHQKHTASQQPGDGDCDRGDRQAA